MCTGETTASFPACCACVNESLGTRLGYCNLPNTPTLLGGMTNEGQTLLHKQTGDQPSESLWMNLGVFLPLLGVCLMVTH